MKPKDEVAIRVWRTDPDDIFALFPAIPATAPGYECTCYQPVGGHGAADYDLCIRKSRPATKTEARPILQELRRIGYRPRTIRRAGRRYLDERLAAFRAMPSAK